MSDVDLKDLLPGPFLTVHPGDQVTVFMDEDVSPDYAMHLKEMLEERAPEVEWVMVLDTGITGVVHVARGDVALHPAPPEPEWVDNGKMWR